jgi:hypothetical protein
VPSPGIDRINGETIPVGRPASGPREIIDYLQRLEEPARRERFGVRRFHVLDDVPLLRAWFEEDGILLRMGAPRLHTTPDGGYFTAPHLWDVLVSR